MERNLEIAIMPGKYNPPHLGHAKTILKLMKEYNLTVCVTSDIPPNAPFTPEEIASEIAELGVETFVFNGVLTEQPKDPWGKLILTGNPKVIEWAKKVGAKYKFIPRSGQISGTQIRNGRNS